MSVTYKITAINKATGEIIELPVQTHSQIVDAWNVAREYEKAAQDLKDQLKELVPQIVDHHGTSEPINGYMFRVSNIQRVNYDKSVMRRVLDEDTFDEFLMPDKPRLDKFLKENLDRLGAASTELRSTMIAVGKPYQVIMLEKIK